jgi:hypothetical protein
MGQALAIIGLVAKLLPLLIMAIKAVEEAIPGQGKGEAKLASVRAIMESALFFVSVSEESPKFEQVWPALEKTTKGLVNAFNTIGEFKK